MAVRRFKQIGVVCPVTIVRPRFRRPSKPIKPGDTVVLEYTDGRIDTVIAQENNRTCYGCKYSGSGSSYCPCCTDKAGISDCIFGDTLYAVDIEAVLEDL